MILKIRDNIFAHQQSTNPYISPSKLTWDRTTPIQYEDLVVYTDTNLLEYRRGNPNNIAWLIEPREYHTPFYNWIEKNYTNFKYVWSHDELIIDLPNGKFVPWGSCWIGKDDHQIHSKKELCNIIASGKNQLKGHRLRHYIIQNFKGFDKFGHGYNPVEHKIEALRDYMFSIVIENTKSPWYFTEKIIDCFKTGTIPIYWGCDNISQFFNSDGILSFNTFEELENILNNLSPDLYNSKRSAIMENFVTGDKYLTVEDWLVINEYI